MARRGFIMVGMTNKKTLNNEVAERIEEKMDALGGKLKVIETKIDRHYEEFQEFRDEFDFKIGVQYEALDSRITKLEGV